MYAAPLPASHPAHPAVAARSSVDPQASLGSDLNHELRTHQGMNLLAFRREVHSDVPRCVGNLLSNYASPWLVLPLSLYSICVFASKSRILHNWPRHCFISQSLTSCIYIYAACNRSGCTFPEFYRSPKAAHAYSQAAWGGPGGANTQLGKSGELQENLNCFFVSYVINLGI